MTLLRRSRLLLALIPVALALSVGTASAGIVFDGSPGSAAPPATLGPYAMTAFGLDPQPEFEVVPSVVDPAGTVGFAPSLFIFASASVGRPGVTDTPETSTGRSASSPRR
jgi:hypothetical protein